MTTVIHTINELRKVIKDWKKAGHSVGLVPTMGALHTGHASLIQKSAETCDKTVVSVFVNPTQFGINEDFSKYPRTLEKDVELANTYNADIVFAPSVSNVFSSLNMLVYVQTLVPTASTHVSSSNEISTFSTPFSP